MKIGALIATLYLRTFHIYSPIWMKFRARDVQIMLLSVLRVSCKAALESHVFPTRVSQITYTLVKKNPTRCNNNNFLINSN